MIPNYTKSNHKNTSGLKSHKFTVKADHHLMKRLSSDIYTRPIEAIIRELSTNAYDAHVDNNKKDVPFYVHFPTREESYFYVKDYGKGLSEKQLVTMFTSYGTSTKQNTNEAVGCLGFGSKSPLAYSDQFQVESINNGEKICALVFKDEDDIPNITILSKTKTTETSSFLVKVSVADKDILNFKRYGKKVFDFFNPRPHFNIQFEEKFLSEKIVIEGKNWKVIDKIGLNNYGNVKVLMGNILYDTSLTVDTHLEISTKNVVLCADIGELEINVSRESIKDTPENEKKLRSYLNSYYLEAKQKANDYIKNNCNKKYEAVILADKFNSFFRAKIKYNFKNNLIGSNISVLNEVQTILPLKKSIISYSVNSDDLKGIIVHKDIKSGAIKATKEYIQKNKFSHASLISGDVNDFCKETEYPKNKIIKASSIYVKPLRSGNKTGRITNNFFKYKKDCREINTNSNSVHWSKKIIGVDLDNSSTDFSKIVYVVISNYKQVSTDYNLYKISFLCRRLGYSLVGIKSHKFDKYKNLNIKSVDQFLKLDSVQSTLCNCFRYNDLFYRVQVSGYNSIPKQYLDRFLSKKEISNIENIISKKKNYNDYISNLGDVFITTKILSAKLDKIKKEVNNFKINLNKEALDRLNIFTNPFEIKKYPELLFDSLDKIDDQGELN